MKNKIRIGVIIATIVLILAAMTFLDYGYLSRSKNLGAYYDILAMVLIIISMIRKEQLNAEY